MSQAGVCLFRVPANGEEGCRGSRSSGPALSGKGNDFSLAFSSEEATFGAM
jgi:hypothetical protein